MRLFITLTYVFGLSLCAYAAQAIESGVQFFAPSSATLDFDPFTGLPAQKMITLEFTNPDADRQLKLIITPETHADFSFALPGASLGLLIDSAGGNQLAGEFTAAFDVQQGQSSQFDVDFKIATGQYADAGNYQLDLLLSIVDDATGEVLIEDRPLRIDCVVPMRAQTNFAGTTPGFTNGIGIATLDFGEITFGDTRQVIFQIRGNTNVKVDMSSENHGFLVHQENAEISPIPYTVDADGVVSDMTAPLTFQRRPEKSLAGSRYPLIVTIEEPEGGAYAGQYRDVLSIDVTPQ